ncbi:hypothetical protein PT974_09030 [Cladobotryum mycophilum]|uniref:Uncharacterized protein n=1 Tax=Cladobotryum mycophilum TaxID=491253 RepID=A0ABR0SF58_9HYPO
MIWIIAVVIIAGLSCLILIALILAKRLRRQKHHESTKRNSDTSSMLEKQHTITNKPSMQGIQELQRRSMIEKSLTSRTSSWATNTSATRVGADCPLDQEATVGLKEDWKEWEAQLHQDQSLSLVHHPAIHDSPQESTNYHGSYLLRTASPSRCHLGAFIFEQDNATIPSTAKPTPLASAWLPPVN